MDSAQPEVSMSLLSDVNLVVTWDQTTPGQIKKMRKGKGAKAAQRLVKTGRVKGYDKLESMVTFVTSPTGFFGLINYPDIQANGSIIMRTIQVSHCIADLFLHVLHPAPSRVSEPLVALNRLNHSTNSPTKLLRTSSSRQRISLNLWSLNRRSLLKLCTIRRRQWT